MDYAEHYAVQARLAQEESLIPAVKLFDLDAEALYSSGMELLASTLPSGRESPFSNKASGSNHAWILSATSHMLEVLGHEIDLMPDRAWINFFRLLGVEQLTGGYPMLEMRFTRAAIAVAQNIVVTIPIGTEIRNAFDSTRSAYLTQTLILDGSTLSGTVVARVDTLGEDSNTRIGAYTNVIQKIPYLESAVDISYISTGLDTSTLAETISTARQGVRTGNLGRLTEKGLIDLEGDRFLGRAVTLRDHIYYAERLGASKANAVKGIAYGANGYYGDLVTVPIYPPGRASSIAIDLAKISDASSRLSVIASEIIPIDGIINIKTAQNFPRQAAIEAISVAIVDTINPPYGTWGDKNFAGSLSTAIERIQGIYAVPNIFLKNASSGVPLEGLDIMPWHLFEVQDTLEINIV
jgi:hypothetical protein